MPFEGPKESHDEFAGMTKEALKENIARQEERIRLRQVDPDEVREIEGLIERMHTRIAQLST